MEVCCVRFPFAANKLKLPFSISSVFQMWIVLLPRGRFQEIKCMMTMHGLFLTCAQKFCLYIYTKHNQLLGPTPFCENDKGNPTYLEGRRSTHSGESPSTLVPCLLATAHPLLSNPPSPPSQPFHPHYVTMTTSTIMIFLVRNMYIYTALYIYIYVYICICCLFKSRTEVQASNFA